MSQSVADTRPEAPGRASESVRRSVVSRRGVPSVNYSVFEQMDEDLRRRDEEVSLAEEKRRRTAQSMQLKRRNARRIRKIPHAQGSAQTLARILRSRIGSRPLKRVPPILNKLLARRKRPPRPAPACDEPRTDVAADAKATPKREVNPGQDDASPQSGTLLNDSASPQKSSTSDDLKGWASILSTSRLEIHVGVHIPAHRPRVVSASAAAPKSEGDPSNGSAAPKQSRSPPPRAKTPPRDRTDGESVSHNSLRAVKLVDGPRPSAAGIAKSKSFSISRGSRTRLAGGPAPVFGSTVHVERSAATRPTTAASSTSRPETGYNGIHLSNALVPRRKRPTSLLPVPATRRPAAQKRPTRALPRAPAAQSPAREAARRSPPPLEPSRQKRESPPPFFFYRGRLFRKDQSSGASRPVPVATSLRGELASPLRGQGGYMLDPPVPRRANMLSALERPSMFPENRGSTPMQVKNGFNGYRKYEGGLSAGGGAALCAPPLYNSTVDYESVYRLRRDSQAADRSPLLGPGVEEPGPPSTPGIASAPPPTPNPMQVYGERMSGQDAFPPPPGSAGSQGRLGSAEAMFRRALVEEDEDEDDSSEPSDYGYYMERAPSIRRRNRFVKISAQVSTAFDQSPRLGSWDEPGQAADAAVDGPRVMPDAALKENGHFRVQRRRRRRGGSRRSSRRTSRRGARRRKGQRRPKTSMGRGKARRNAPRPKSVAGLCDAEGALLRGGPDSGALLGSPNAGDKGRFLPSVSPDAVPKPA